MRAWSSEKCETLDFMRDARRLAARPGSMLHLLRGASEIFSTNNRVAGIEAFGFVTCRTTGHVVRDPYGAAWVLASTR